MGSTKRVTEAGEKGTVLLEAENRRPIGPREGRHEVITARGTYEYAKNGVVFTASNEEVQYFSYDHWRITLTPDPGSTTTEAGS